MVGKAEKKDRIENITIVGGGTAGWMAAAALSKVLGTKRYNIKLVESDEIGTVGVGEASIPHLLIFNRILGIDENEFLRETQGTFKLGIEFVNWRRKGHSYMHGFSRLGREIGSLAFYNYWLKLKATGKTDSMDDYSIAAQVALKNRFTRPIKEKDSPLSDIAHAYQFDATLYAKFLRKFAEKRGVQREEGIVSDVELNPDSGFIERLHMEDGRSVEGDLFIDCSGFKGLLIEGALKTGYEDWSHWLMCDSAVAVPCAQSERVLPYTRSIAHDAGWQWRIPLQHRIGNGHVYSSAHISDEEAKKTLLANLDGEPLAEPRYIRFKTGVRKKFWNKNCVAIGLSSGFIEPLESTSIHFVQMGISQLLNFFPSEQFEEVNTEKYNSLMINDVTAVRDFIIMHYHVTERDDSKFWRQCRTMDIPDTLKQKIDLYRRTGKVHRDNNELFGELSWMLVMECQGAEAQNYHPLVDAIIGDDELYQLSDKFRSVIATASDAVPTHEDYIARYCKAPLPTKV